MTNVQERLQAAVAGRYAIERELGRGGMATVYLARDLRYERLVAIKVLDPEVGAAVGAERFQREIAIAAQLQHVNILSFYESGEGADLLFYVMPYVEGESLRERLERETQLSLEDAIGITREVASALAYAHSHGVVHRDIKPENIMLSGGHAVVADFGIARALSEADNTALTKTGVTIGTPLYMSPEQAAASHKVDGRSDVYSLGCVLYEMLAGAPPFVGPTAQAVIARHALDALPPIRTVRPTVPEIVELTLERALAKVPADRFATAHQFAEALSSPEAVRMSTQGALYRTPIPVQTPRPRRRVPAWAMIGAAVAVAGAAVVVGIRWNASSHAGRQRVVVLPFHSNGPAEDEYFADGISDEITGRLTAIRQLGVIARTSAMQYKNTTKTISQIGDELAVDYVVEGTVQWYAQDGARHVKLSPAVIRVSNQETVWTRLFDVPIGQAASVQGRIAEGVAQALDLALDPVERRRVVDAATENPEAYDFFLRGNSYYNHSWEQGDVETAIEMYRRAVTLDSTFAPAFAALGRSHAWFYQLYYDRTESRLAAARAAIDRAIALDPELPDAHIALGQYYYWGRREYQRAIDEFGEARRLQPGNAMVFNNVANVNRRQGRWGETIDNYRRAADLDPRSHVILFNLGEALTLDRQYDRADSALRQVITLQPGFIDAYAVLATIAIHRDGDTAAARAVLDSAAGRVPPSQWRPLVHHWRLGLYRIVKPRPDEILPLIVPGMYGLDSAAAYLARGEVLLRSGRAAQGRAAVDTARVALERLVARHAEQAPIRGELGIAYASLGRDGEAVAAAEGAVQLLPTEVDALDGPDLLYTLARVYAMVGRPDDAIRTLERMLSIPSRISANWLRLDPVWAPLRGRPGFQRLIAPGRRAPAVAGASRPARAGGD